MPKCETYAMVCWEILVSQSFRVVSIVIVVIPKEGAKGYTCWNERLYLKRRDDTELGRYVLLGWTRGGALGREYGIPPLTPVGKDATQGGKPLERQARLFISPSRCKACCWGSIRGRGFPYGGKAAGVARCGKAARR